MKQLVISGLCKAFGPHQVLSGLDLDVPSGSLTAILGPSGSGKTTLLRILAGFEQADAGTVAIGDMVVDSPALHVPPERRRIGYVPQEGSLFPHLTVAANVAFGLPRRQRRGSRSRDLLATVGLADFGQRYPHELSGGQQQRVALARALAIRPSVVLLDEPFASLDAHLRASVRADVQQIFREAGTTALLVTHDQDEALAIADRVAVLRDGRIAQYCAPQELYSAPVDSQVARFIGEANLLDGACHAGIVDTVLGALPVRPRPSGHDFGPVTVLIRPEHIELRAASGTEDQACTGRVVECDYYGHDSVLRVRLERHAAEPVPTEPETTEPETTGPAKTEPTPAGPVKAEPTPAAPTTAGPTPAAPKAAAPTTAAPKAAGPVTPGPQEAGATSAVNTAMPSPGGTRTSGEIIIVRTSGDHAFAPGSLVTLHARGPVRTWPR